MTTIILPNLNKDENKYKRTFGNKSLTEQALEKALDNSELIQMCESSFDEESVKQGKFELINSIIKCLGL